MPLRVAHLPSSATDTTPALRATPSARRGILTENCLPTLPRHHFFSAGNLDRSVILPSVNGIMALLHPKLYFTLFAIFGINFCYF